MRRSAKESLLSAILLGALLAASAPVAADEVTDSSITSWVNEALRHDPLVPASEISVRTQEGVVTLSGRVDNLAVKNRVDRQATKIRGVREVLNELTVAPSPLSDADIVYNVRRRILNSATIVSQRIVVTSVDGNVTIQGEVANWSEAEEAALLASAVTGVKNVKNELVTRYTATRSDREIKNNAVAALHRDVYLTGFPITVSVEDGVVSLTGSVGNAYQKRRAAQAARRVSHVTFVKNELVVRPEERGELRERVVYVSDDALVKAIREELAEDVRVDASEIEPRASDGEVTLEGSVTNLAQKRTAEQDARDVVGVAWVTNDLFVKTEQPEDWIIRDDVDFNLDTDSTLAPFDLESSVKDGVVTLTGRVHDGSQKSHATDVAGRVRAVRLVVNEIRVQPETGTITENSDATLARAIRDSFRRNWTTSRVADRIRVDVEDGVATLTGDLDTWDERLEAGSVALRTEGVWKVQNRLTVKGYDYEWEKWEYEAPYYYEELFPNVG
ncbi:MAG: BON domain-containing protein [Gemmatimonadota bacterium]